MHPKIGRLFVIKTRLDACLIVNALALGAAERGIAYLDEYPGVFGELLFLACISAVVIAGAKIFECLNLERQTARRPAL